MLNKLNKEQKQILNEYLLRLEKELIDYIENYKEKYYGIVDELLKKLELPEDIKIEIANVLYDCMAIGVDAEETIYLLKSKGIYK